jgi:hypothetical protein
MASPFKIRKKARLRERKAAEKLGALEFELQDRNPELAAVAKRVIEGHLRHAHRKRR